jgi:UDP-N-acetylglucosamine 2-epimerase (non-hydrolysing)
MKVLSIFGIRPGTIKIASLVHALTTHERFDSKACVIAQHRKMLVQMLGVFQIKPVT